MKKTKAAPTPKKNTPTKTIATKDVPSITVQRHRLYSKVYHSSRLASVNGGNTPEAAKVIRIICMNVTQTYFDTHKVKKEIYINMYTDFYIWYAEYMHRFIYDFVRYFPDTKQTHTYN
jgi:hypothetical protein